MTQHTIHHPIWAPVAWLGWGLICCGRRLFRLALIGAYGRQQGQLIWRQLQ